MKKSFVIPLAAIIILAIVVFIGLSVRNTNQRNIVVQPASTNGDAEVPEVTVNPQANTDQTVPTGAPEKTITGKNPEPMESIIREGADQKEIEIEDEIRNYLFSQLPELLVEIDNQTVYPNIVIEDSPHEYGHYNSGKKYYNVFINYDDLTDIPYWSSFLVSEGVDEIFIIDDSDDEYLSPEEWRRMLADNRLLDYMKTLGIRAIPGTCVLFDDIDLDGNPEYVLMDDKKYVYVIRKKNDEYYTVGVIEPDQDVIVMSRTNIRFIKIDQSGKKYIFMNLENFMSGLGLELYGIQGDAIELIDWSFPTATGIGTRTMEDKDGDGIYERVNYVGYHDYQEHVKAVYFIWDGQAFKESEEKILYAYGGFTYPEQPEDVVECFIAAACIGLKDEMDEMAENQKATEFSLSEYYKVDEYGPHFTVEVVANEGTSVILVAIPDSEYRESENDIYFKVIKVSDKWKIESVYPEPSEVG